MPIDEEQLSKAPASRFNRDVLTRQVKTPMVGENGYYSEENTITVHKQADYSAKVHKVSTRGWTVTLYEDGKVSHTSGEYFIREGDAHSHANTLLMEATK